MKRFWNHPWTVLVCNWLIVMGIYSLSRLFYYWTNVASYPDVTFSHLMEMIGGGIRFDLTALLYLNSVYILLMLLPLPMSVRENRIYQGIAKGFYLVPNIVGIIVNCADMVYMQFTGRRTTVTFFSEFENDSNLTHIFFTAAAQYWYVTVFGIAMITILLLLMRKLPNTANPLPTTNRPWLYYVRETVILCASVYFVVIGIRGGFGAFTRPITLSNALQYTNHPNETNIVLNTPFTLMRSSEGRVFTNIHYFEENELETIMNPIHESEKSIAASRKNVVVFILESFSKEYIGFYNHDLDDGTYTGYTPFLDSLCAHALTFDLSLSNGRKSIDAMPSVLSSIPMLIAPYILTPYSTNTVSSIASYLGAKGWQTGFFHGAPNGSMGFMAYARSCGFDAYYGKDEYNNNADYDGYWAIWDEEFLQFYGRTMSTMQEPFMTAVFTATSHHPFQVPARYEGVFPEGTDPIHHCIGYTDNALRRFFDYAKTQEWYNHTLFVLTADHTNALTHPEYTNDKGRYEVPIIFFDPHMDEQIRTRKRNYPVAQVDILPSVLSYIGYDEPYFAFGQDVIIADKEAPYVVNYNAPVYQIFSDSLLLQFDGKEVTGLYDFRNDRTLQTNLKAKSEEAVPQQMLQYLKATIQQYVSRMRENRLGTE